MRAAPAKFLFENDFARGSEGKPSIPVDEHAVKVAAAEVAAFTRGFEQGQREAREAAEERAAAAVERIAAAAEVLDRQLGAVEARIEAESIDIAVAVAKKLIPGLLAREPFAEIAALATSCFRNLVKCPHVVVRVNDALHATAREKLSEMVQRSSPDTKLVVLAEPDIAVGDCRIEWADGGIDRDGAAIAAAIDEAVTRYINGRRAAAEGSAVQMPGMKRRDER